MRYYVDRAWKDVFGKFLTTAQATARIAATCNETDTSLRNEHNIGLRYRRMHFGLAIRCPPPCSLQRVRLPRLYVRARPAAIG